MKQRRYLLSAEDHKRTRIRFRGYLPHWECEGATYSCTWRLHDSLPAPIIRRLQEERRELLRRAEREHGCITVLERARLDEAFSPFSLQLDRHLDAGYGSCVLREKIAAQIVKDALLHFVGERYDLHAWCVMPNHVHVAMTPVSGHSLDEIFHSWKSYTAHEINKVLGRRGTLWQKEYFDRIVRDADDMVNVLSYIAGNPSKAGLRDWPWVWREGW